MSAKMMAGIQKIVDAYDVLVNDYADPRVKNYFLMSSPWPVLCLTGLYLYISKSIGPRLMKIRKPFKLKKVVMLYNVCQIAMSTYMSIQGARHIFSDKYNIKCAPVDYSNDPEILNLLFVIWLYFFSKVTEFLDTIFFVLRKKNEQISFLHVYHHSLMAVMCWVGVKYMAGGHALVMGTLNAFVHVVMYTYYLIAGLGPQYQKYVWWKKHVTVLQLTQFVIVFIHNISALFNPSCSYPKLANIIMCANAILFIKLFGQFFIASYIKKPSQRNGTAKNGSAAYGTVQNGKAKNGSTNNGNGHTSHLSEKNGVKISEKHKND